MKPEQERLVAVLKDTVSLLCKNSLTYEEQVVVQGVICITVDKQDVVVVPVHENLGLAEYDPCLACGHAKEPPPGEKNSRKRKRRRRSSSGASRSPETYDDPREEEYDEDAEEAERVKIKKEEPELSDDEDLILIDEDIKREHNNNDNSFITGYMDNSQLSSITATPQSLSSQPQTQQQQLQQQQQHFQGPASWQGTPGAASTQALAMPDGSDGMAASQKMALRSVASRVGGLTRSVVASATPYRPLPAALNRTQSILPQCNFHASPFRFNENIVQIQDADDFDKKVLKNSVPVVLDFHATWCGPCKMLGPRLEEMVSENEGKVILAKVDIDEHTEIAMEYGVQAVPTVIAMKGGKVQETFVGLKDDAALQSFIDKLIN
eukprot:GHVO01027994.1.p1 GENE.GHVO01027994.1~~GHVO01027994.1.p1  ORF type:complete len:379 (+),score=57.01 GHVO01027994.1:94-1230(+)